AKEWLKGEIIAANRTKMPGTRQNVSSDKNSGNSPTSSLDSENTISADNKDSLVNIAKPKKSLLGKVKDKAKAIIND
ncbi:MAG: hypothetical protein WBM83_05890, partial [Flavobacteriaceae bacterium]